MNRDSFLRLLGSGLILFGAFSSSTSYQLKSYSIGSGGASNSSSATYHLNGSVGEQANGTTSSANYKANNGSTQTFQLNLPSAPTVGNGSGTYYNRLSFIVNTSNEPSDATYAIAVSSSGCNSSVSYVQADGTLGSSQVYQSYSAWGGSSGSIMTGLAPSTSNYYVSEAAQEGMFTNTEFGSCNSIGTVAPTITFSVSPNTLSMGNLSAGSVVTSSNLSFSFATNADWGGSVYASGQNNGLSSSNASHTIAAFTGNLAGQSEGFGVQATNPSQSSGGPLSTVSPFNGSSHTVGAETTTPQPMLTTSNPIAGGSANANTQAIISTTTPASADYQETLNFVASASF